MHNDQGIVFIPPTVLNEMNTTSKLVYECKILIIIQ